MLLQNPKGYGRTQYKGRTDQYGTIRHCGIVAPPWVMLSSKLDDYRIDGGDGGQEGQRDDVEDLGRVVRKCSAGWDE